MVFVKWLQRSNTIMLILIEELVDGRKRAGIFSETTPSKTP